MPRPGQPDEPDQAGCAADDGLVYRLPPRARAVSAATGGDFQHRLGAAGRSASPRTPASAGESYRSQQADKLYDLSPVSGAYRNDERTARSGCAARAPSWTTWQGILAQPGGTGRNGRFPGSAAPRVPTGCRYLGGHA